MHRFFVSPENITDDKIFIYGDDYNHIKNVLRLTKGDDLIAGCGREFEYKCRIESINDDVVETIIIEKKENENELGTDFVLFQALPKSDKMDFIIQKNVELGIKEIVPFRAKRCVVKYDDKKSEKKAARWQEIARAAAKQSGRGIVPKIHEILSFDEAINYAMNCDIAFIPYELSENIDNTKELFGKIEDGKSVAFMIGPEGGFESGEVNLAKEKGLHPITLGKRILRTETAGMALMSYFMLKTEMENEDE